MPDGTPIEDAGIVPEIAVNALPEAYKEKDPTWEKAVEVLRTKALR
jgi:C-terminal processing protease CtpA/Prc